MIEPYVPETREQELNRMFEEAQKRVVSGEAGPTPAGDKNGDMKPLLTGLAAKNAMDAVMLPPRAKDPLDDVLDTAMNPANPAVLKAEEKPADLADEGDSDEGDDPGLDDEEEIDDLEDTEDDDLDDEDDFDESDDEPDDETEAEEDEPAATEPPKKAPEAQSEQRKPEPQPIAAQKPNASPPPPQAPAAAAPQAAASQQVVAESVSKKEVADLRAMLAQSQNMLKEMRETIREFSKKDGKIKEVEDLRNMLSASQGTLAETQTALTEIKKTIHGIGERSESKQKKPILPLMPSDLSKIVRKAPQSLPWLRDTAMILMCFTAALRQTEVLSVRLEQIRFTRDEFYFTFMSRSRGRPDTKRTPIIRGPLCVAEAVARWINASGIKYGYLFRKVRQGTIDQNQESHLKPADVTAAVKKAVGLIGLDPDHYDWQSLRKGYVKVVQEISRRSRDADAIRDNMQPVIAEE